ncbi:MAG: DUF3014 domain-containing protein [Pseudomonadales bacterium]
MKTVNDDAIQSPRRPGQNPGGSNSNTVWIVVALVAIVLGVAAWFWYAGQTPEVDTEPMSVEPIAEPPPPLTTREEEPEVTRETVVTTPPPTTVEAPPPALPSLESSDEFVRERFDDWGLPELVTQQEDLLPQLSVFIANAADGLVPTRLLKPVAPRGKFKIAERGETVYLDSETYDRYDNYVGMLERVPPTTAASFVRQVEPLLTDGLADVGELRSPKSLIQQAIQRLNALPTLPDQIELVQNESVYEYADENLETLPEFEKQLLRLGPENLARLKAWANEFAAAYELN